MWDRRIKLATCGDVRMTGILCFVSTSVKMVHQHRASLICLSSVKTLFLSVLCSLHQQQRFGALKQPLKPTSNVLRPHCFALRATSAPNLFSDPSLYLFYKGEIDDRALLGIWQQDRKIVHSI